MTRDIAMALKSLHQQGIVHRDVRSANTVMLTRGQFMLIDVEGATYASDFLDDKYSDKNSEVSRFTSWTDQTWEMVMTGGWENMRAIRQYTELSDMEQFGVMLSPLLERVCPADVAAAEIVQNCILKRLTAEAVLKSPWLADCL